MSLLTPTQRAVLRAIFLYVRERGYAPSTREIAPTIGMCFQYVDTVIQALVRKGLLTRANQSGRSLALTEAGRAAICLSGSFLYWRRERHDFEEIAAR